MPAVAAAGTGSGAGVAAGSAAGVSAGVAVGVGVAAGGGVHVFEFEVGDDQVEARIGARQRQCLGARLYVGDARHMLQVELVRFANQHLVQPAVFAQNERVVQARHQQDVLHPERHQVFESFEKLFLFNDGFERWIGAHAAILTPPMKPGR